ncbi:hypothetical protein ACXZ1M_00600 [Duganella sp. PWIR1]
MDFPEEFDGWLASVLAPELPSTLVAFSFNLFELDSTDARYGIELVGADEFDLNDTDWACGEVWVANPHFISIPRAFADEGWEKCLDDTKRLLANALAKPSILISKLKDKRAVAIGFVDGDLELIWQR